MSITWICYEHSIWSEWQDLNLRPLPPQAKGYGFLRDIASNTCFFVRKNWYKVRCVLLSPGSSVLKVVKYVVVKSAPIWCGQASRERIILFAVIVVRSCRRFISDSAHLRLSYFNSFGNVCQEVSRVNIWDTVIKEKEMAPKCRYVGEKNLNIVKRTWNIGCFVL